MKAILLRKYGQKQTEGSFSLYNDAKEVIFRCVTLELPYLNNERKISCFPEGIYKVTKHISPSKGLCFSIHNVPQRDNILIHKANFVGSNNPKTGHSDLLGCVAPGTGYSDLNADGIVEVINSGATMEKLLDVAPDEFELTVSKKP